MSAAIPAICAALFFIIGFGGGAFMAISKVKDDVIPMIAASRKPKKKKEIKVDKLSMMQQAKTPDNLIKAAEELTTMQKDIDEKRKKLLEMDADILRRESLIRAEKGRLDIERQKLVEIQNTIEKRLIKMSEAEAAAYEEQSGYYASMKIDQTINLFRGMKEEEVIKILKFFKPKQTSKLLETWSRAYPEDREKLHGLMVGMRTLVTENFAPGGAAAQ